MEGERDHWMNFAEIDPESPVIAGDFGGVQFPVRLLSFMKSQIALDFAVCLPD